MDIGSIYNLSEKDVNEVTRRAPPAFLDGPQAFMRAIYEITYFPFSVKRKSVQLQQRILIILSITLPENPVREPRKMRRKQTVSPLFPLLS